MLEYSKVNHVSRREMTKNYRISQRLTALHDMSYLEYLSRSAFTNSFIFKNFVLLILWEKTFESMIWFLSMCPYILIVSLVMKKIKHLRWIAHSRWSSETGSRTLLVFKEEKKRRIDHYLIDFNVASVHRNISLTIGGLICRGDSCSSFILWTVRWEMIGSKLSNDQKNMD